MEILNFFKNLSNAEELASQYKTSSPIPHVIIDDFFPADIFKNLCNDISNYPANKWTVKNLSSTSGIRKEARDFTDSYTLQNVMLNFTGHSFVSWMSKITGVSNIIPDPHHLGAGLTAAPSGATLGLHIDFNWNDTLKLNRKFNLIFYANDTWQNSWNGDLEFWNKEGSECLYTISPTPNRLIFWEYEQDLIHGFTKPLACPQDVERQNLMTIYYTSNASPATQPHKSQFY